MKYHVLASINGLIEIILKKELQGNELVQLIIEYNEAYSGFWDIDAWHYL